MRIAVFEPNYGIPRQHSVTQLIIMRNHLERFRRLGHEPLVYTEPIRGAKGHGREVREVRGLLTNLRRVLTPVQEEIPPYAGLSSPDVLFGVAQLMRREPPDVLYSVGTAFSCLPTALLSGLTGVPSVHYVTDSTIKWRWWLGDMEVFAGYNVSRWRFVTQVLRDAPRELARRATFARWGLEKVSRVVVPFDHVRLALGTLSIDASDLDQVPLGVEVPDPVTTAVNTRDEVVYFGHLWQGRGVLDLVRAIEIVRRTTDIGLVVAANNVQRLTFELFDDLVLRLGLKGHVRIVGVVQDLAKEILLPSRVVVLPYRDTPSIKLLESMALGLPVVTTRIGWTPEVIEDGANGLLVPPADVDALATAIRYVVENPEVAVALGRAARKTIAGRFSLDQSATEMLRVLEAAT